MSSPKLRARTSVRSKDSSEKAYPMPMQSLAYAWRSLRRAPAFAVTAVLTLGVGIGATVAIFSVVDAIAIRQLPYGHPDRLVGAWHDLPGVDAKHATQGLATYLTYTEFAHSLAGIGVYKQTSVNLGGDRTGTPPERVHAASMTANLLPLLETGPRVGRNFSAEEDAPKGPNVVLISDGLWKRRFGADPNIIGKSIEVSAAQYQVIGVMSPSFHFPDAETQIWVPQQIDRNDPTPGGFNYNGIARLKPGVTIKQATAEMQSVLPRAPELSPNLAPGVPTQMLLDKAKPIVVLDPLRDDIVGSFASILWIVGGAAILILGVACANVANLLLVRAEARHRETAVRTALGAGRAHLLRQFFAEGVVLSMLGGVIGVALAIAGVRMFVAWGPPDIPRLAEVSVGFGSMAFALVVVVLVAVVFSVLPMLRRGDADLGSVLKDGGRGGTSGVGRQRMRATLVTAQVALAVMALATSGVLGRTFQKLHDVKPGFDPSNTLTMWVSPSRTAFPGGADITRFYQQVIDRVGALPGVKHVGVTSRVPLELDGDDMEPIWREDAPALPGDKLPSLSMFEQTSGGYFAAMGIPLLAGQTFARLDRPVGQP
ncbi:MAG: ABC transporter permease, partial [Gemmatimonadaceae bacterium]